MATISFEGINFNKEWILSFKNKQAFIDAIKHKEKDGSGYSHFFEGDPKRIEKFEELYKLAKAEPDPNIDLGMPSVDGDKPLP